MRHVRPKSNQIYSRYKFLSRVQKDTDTFEEYLTDLKILVKVCGYATPDEMVRDAIVFGTKDHTVREKCINEGSDLTLEKAVNFGRTLELSKAQLKSMAGEDKSVNIVSKSKQGPSPRFNTGRYHNKPESKTKSPWQNQKGQPKKQCRNCGNKHEPHKCPAFGKQCSKCHKYNHYASVCLSTQKTPKKLNVLDISDTESEELFVAMIEKSVNTIQTDEWVETMIINNVPIKFQLDTGAKYNVLSKTTLNTLSIQTTILKPDAPLRSYSGHLIEPVGVVHLTCTRNNQIYNVKFYIVDRDVQPVIDAKTCQVMKLVKHIHAISPNENPPNKTNTCLPVDMEKEYPDLFKGLGCLPGTHTIRVDETITPVVHPPRKIPIVLKDRVKSELDRMEEIGVIVKQHEPTKWVNSMVTVQKPNGKLRICIDPRDLNKATLREHYPLRTVEEVISQMPNAKIFSKLDATSGFWQLRLDEPSSKLCTFIIPYGRHRVVRLPFGIKSAPEVFQKIISQMVSDIEGAEAIIDDILVWGSDHKEHDQCLKKVLDRAREYNLKLGAGKCEIRKSEVTYVRKPSY